MTVFLSHETAWSVWHKIGKPPIAQRCSNPLIPLPNNSNTARSLYYNHVPKFDMNTQGDMFMYGIEDEQRPLHVVAPSACMRRNGKELKCHVLNVPLPFRSFYELEPRLFICAPELVFLQMAANKRVALSKLILMGYELCGMYARIPQNSGKHLLVQRVPITSLEKLHGFIDEIEDMAKRDKRVLRGLKKARQALKYVIEYAASPMETLLCILLTLPPSKGGYGLPAPALNKCMINGQLIYKATGRNALISDLFWAAQRLDVEYDSDEHHNDSYNRYRDDEKRNALLDHNFKVLTANKLHVLNYLKTDVIAKQIARALNVRIRANVSDWEARRRKLRHELFSFESLSEL